MWAVLSVSVSVGVSLFVYVWSRVCARDVEQQPGGEHPRHGCSGSGGGSNGKGRGPSSVARVGLGASRTEQRVRRLTNGLLAMAWPLLAWPSRLQACCCCCCCCACWWRPAGDWGPPREIGCAIERGRAPKLLPPPRQRLPLEQNQAPPNQTGPPEERPNRIAYGSPFLQRDKTEHGQQDPISRSSTHTSPYGDNDY